MPVPGSMQDLAQQANSNFPTGSELIGTNLDDYLRAHASIVRRIYSLASLPVAAASTTDVTNSDGESVEITGSATVNSLGAGFIGCTRELRFAGACVLLHSNNLVLQGKAQVSVQAGDVLTFRCTAPGQWKQVANSNAVTKEALQQAIEAAIGSASNMSVTPKVFTFESDGEQTDFLMAAAGVGNPLLYDVYVESAGTSRLFYALEPFVDFTVVAGDEAQDWYLRLVEAKAEGFTVFAVLRGYAKPWIGDPPITTVAPKIVGTVTGDTILDASFHNTLIVISSADDVTLTIRANTGGETDWKPGQFFSTLQLGTGKVRIAIEAGGEVLPPDSFANETRAQGSVISATCYAPDSDAWVSSGDLLRSNATPSRVVVELIDRTALSTTDITTGGKDTYVLPFGMILDAVIDGGVYGSVMAAQASGTPLQVNIRRNGTSIFSTRPTFDNGERSTRTAATPAVYAAGGSVLYAGDEIDLDVSQVGTAGARGLRFYLVGQRAN